MLQCCMSYYGVIDGRIQQANSLHRTTGQWEEAMTHFILKKTLSTKYDDNILRNNSNIIMISIFDYLISG